MPSLIRAIASLFSYSLFSGSTPFQNQYSPALQRHCDHVSPITQPEFDARQSGLAKTLVQLGGAAYITESSGNSQYFGNFSVANWKLSERPLLLIIQPILNVDGSVQPRVVLLTPKFEHRRALSLPIPSFNNTGVHYVDWAEDEDPYQIAFRSLSLSPSSDATIFVDSGIRKFVVDGLENAAPSVKVKSAPLEITSLRERKSRHELEIMKCVNEATVLAIRDVHKRMSFMMRESQVRRMLAEALLDVGLQNGGCLTLFGANAALPHGSGTDRVLTPSDFALFDCGGSLHGYQSDVTRTVALPGSRITDRHLELWDIVQSVQATAFSTVKAGVLTREPDEVARRQLQELSLERYFTHRLGHGIGLDGHERPYLRGNSDDVIQPGHTFSNEPGIYIEGEVGVRLEDCLYINEEGSPVYLTEGPQLSPWAP